YASNANLTSPWMKSSFTGSGTPTKTVDQNDSPPHVRAVTTSDIDLGVSQDAKKLLNQAMRKDYESKAT
ncbi:hypothetical protein KTJ28_15685, partial [Acinetobacter baumannii]|nr:hypothetical protein [Acinetobacter baumannii]